MSGALRACGPPAPARPPRRAPVTLSGVLAGYDHLLAAARRLQWDDAAIDLTADAAAFPLLPADHAERIRRLIAGFCVAEAAVAEHLVPFLPHAPAGAAHDCFALQQGDEERHARFFARAAREVLALDPGDEARGLAGDDLVALFEHELPARAARLAGEADDADAPDPAAMADAVALYHLVLEGIVFAAGQDALLAALEDAGTLPGLREGVTRVQGDERWHVGLGVLHLRELGRAAPELDDVVALAARAWGPHADVAQALAAHGRRLGFVTPAPAG